MDAFRDGFAARLSALLEERGLPRKGRQVWLVRQFLFRAVPLTQGAVNKWLSGLAVPDTDKLRIIADIFEVSLDWLIAGSGPRSATQVTPEVSDLLAILDNMTPAQRRQVKAIAHTLLDDSSTESASKTG